MKTLMLWLLFMIAIAFVIKGYIVNADVSDDKNDRYEATISKSYLDSMVLPKHIIVNFDSADKTQILNKQGEFFDNFIDNLSKAFGALSSFEKVDYSAIDDIYSAKWISLIFNDMPGVYIASLAGIKNDNLASLENIKEIYQLSDSKITYIKTQDAVYELKSKFNNELGIDSLQNSMYQRYFPIFYPINENKNLLLPIKPDMYMQKLSSRNLIENSSVSTVAKNIFRENFDFTSSIVQKDGIYFYSYNNGQQVLKISSDAMIEYKNSKYGASKTNYEDAFNCLSVFLRNLEIEPDMLKIQRVYEVIEDGVQKIRFELIGKHIGISVVSDKGASVVDVVGKSVVHAKMSLLYADDYDGKIFSLSNPRNVLNNNLDFLQRLMMNRDSGQLIRQIRDINLLYFYDGKGTYIPCWAFEIGGYVIFFDAQDGELVHYAVV